jgi:hypothetical protein
VFEKRVLRRIVSPNKVPPKKRVRSVCWTWGSVVSDIGLDDIYKR